MVHDYMNQFQSVREVLNVSVWLKVTYYIVVGCFYVLLILNIVPKFWFEHNIFRPVLMPDLNSSITSSILNYKIYINYLNNLFKYMSKNEDELPSLIFF